MDAILTFLLFECTVELSNWYQCRRAIATAMDDSQWGEVLQLASELRMIGNSEHIAFAHLHIALAYYPATTRLWRPASDAPPATPHPAA